MKKFEVEIEDEIEIKDENEETLTYSDHISLLNEVVNLGKKYNLPFFTYYTMLYQLLAKLATFVILHPEISRKYNKKITKAIISCSKDLTKKSKTLEMIFLEETLKEKIIDLH